LEAGPSGEDPSGKRTTAPERAVQFGRAEGLSPNNPTLRGEGRDFSQMG